MSRGTGCANMCSIVYEFHSSRLATRVDSTVESTAILEVDSKLQKNVHEFYLRTRLLSSNINYYFFQCRRHVPFLLGAQQIRCCSPLVVELWEPSRKTYVQKACSNVQGRTYNKNLCYVINTNKTLVKIELQI
jgi:hypothetical protein